MTTPTYNKLQARTNVQFLTQELYDELRTEHTHTVGEKDAEIITLKRVTASLNEVIEDQIEQRRLLIVRLQACIDEQETTIERLHRNKYWYLVTGIVAGGLIAIVPTFLYNLGV